MAVGTLGTLASTSLPAVTFNALGATTSTINNTLAAADMASIANAITSDLFSAATNPTGILATGATHSNTTLDSLVAVAGGGLATIQVGSLILGVNASTGAFVIPPGTFVVAKPTGTSVTLSQAATNTSAGMKILIMPPSDGINGSFSFNGQLAIPGRGVLKVLPGDVVAIDGTGWPILVSASAIAYAGTAWSKA